LSAAGEAVVARIVVIGGNGHLGTYLLPTLVERGHEVVGEHIARLRPDIVVDMISYALPSTKPLVEALRGEVEHFLHCGTIWQYGHNATIPSTEDDPTSAECAIFILLQCRHQSSTPWDRALQNRARSPENAVAVVANWTTSSTSSQGSSYRRRPIGEPQAMGFHPELHWARYVPTP
jgi:hypothetical protein